MELGRECGQGKSACGWGNTWVELRGGRGAGKSFWGDSLPMTRSTPKTDVVASLSPKVAQPRRRKDPRFLPRFLTRA